MTLVETQLPERMVTEALALPEPPDAAGEWRLNDLRFALLNAAVSPGSPEPGLVRSMRETPSELAAMGLHGPVPLTGDHRVDSFDCGIERLNQGLRNPSGEGPLASLGTYVLADADGKVVAYYAFRPVEAFRQADPEGPRLTLVLISRLAIDTKWHRSGLMRQLAGCILGHAASLPFETRFAALIGFAIDERAQRVFISCGAHPMANVVHPLGIVVSLADIEAVAGMP